MAKLGKVRVSKIIYGIEKVNLGIQTRQTIYELSLYIVMS